MHGDQIGELFTFDWLKHNCMLMNLIRSWKYKLNGAALNLAMLKKLSAGDEFSWHDESYFV